MSMCDLWRTLDERCLRRIPLQIVHASTDCLWRNRSSSTTRELLDPSRSPARLPRHRKRGKSFARVIAMPARASRHRSIEVDLFRFPSIASDFETVHRALSISSNAYVESFRRSAEFSGEEQKGASSLPAPKAPFLRRLESGIGHGRS